MRVLVTGASGFIGLPLSNTLRDLGFDVWGLVRFVSGGRPLPDVKLVRGDLNDYHSVVRAVEFVRPEIVVHLGALTPVSESFRMPVAYMQTNLIGTVNLCEALRKHTFETLRVFIFAGTTEMFDHSGMIRPDTPLDPTSPYSVSKIGAVYYLRYMLKTYRFPYVVVVPTNTYGRAPVRQNHFVIEKIITEMLVGRKEIRMGNPDSVRDFMFREDHVNAYVTLIKAITDQGKDLIGETFTFGTGKGHTIKEVFEMIADITGWLGKVKWCAFTRPNEPRKIVVDYSKAKHVLGWEPKYGILDGLTKAVSEWEEVLTT